MWPVTFSVAILYFLIAKGALPVWLTWFIMLTSAVGFKVSPHTCSVVPISPGLEWHFWSQGSLGESGGCFCFQRLFPRGAERRTAPEQRSSRRVLPHTARDSSLCTTARLLLPALLCQEDLVLLWQSLAVATYCSRETNVVFFVFVYVNIFTQRLLMGHW